MPDPIESSGRSAGSPAAGAGRHAAPDAVPDDRRSSARTVGRWLLGLALATAGIAHLTVQRREFQAQVPEWFPLSDDPVVIGSGLIELTLGAALIGLPRRRVLVGTVVAAFFVAIFPGNVGQWLEGTDAFGLDTDAKRFGRLFFQPVLVAWALWSTGAWSAWRAGTWPHAAGDRSSTVSRHRKSTSC